MFKLEKLKDKAVLTIYGYVGGLYLDFRAVNAALADITKSGYKALDFRIHTYGGTVFDGNLIYMFVAGFKGEVDIYIDGVAASMGSVIMTAGKRIHIAENGFIMVHAPRGGAEGTAKDFVQYAKLLRSMEANFINKLMERTGKPEGEVKAWMDGTDYWFDADEAITIGLADDKFTPKGEIIKIDKKEASTIGAQATYERFAACFIPDNSKNENKEMNKADLISRYKLTGVTAESTDEEILAAVDAKVNAGAKAQEEAQKAVKNAIVAAVDKAVTDKIITKEQRDTYIARGEKLGLEELNTLLAEVKPYTPVIPQLGGKGAEGSGEDRSKWGWKEYQEKAVAALEEMAKKDPEKFNAIYKAEFGKEPEI